MARRRSAIWYLERCSVSNLIQLLDWRPARSQRLAPVACTKNSARHLLPPNCQNAPDYAWANEFLLKARNSSISTDFRRGNRISQLSTRGVLVECSPSRDH